MRPVMARLTTLHEAQSQLTIQDLLALNIMLDEMEED